MKKIIVISMSILLSGMLLMSCGKSGKPGNDQNPSPSGGAVVLSENTVVLDDQAQAGIVSASADQGQITFSGSTSQLAAMKVGDPLIVGVTPSTPSGLMGKVTSVSTSADGQVTVTTEPAALNEVFETLTVSHEQTLGASNIMSVESPYLVSSAASALKNAYATVTGSDEYTATFNLSPDDSVRNTYTITLKTSFLLDIDIRLFSVKKMVFRTSPHLTVVHTMGVQGEVTLADIQDKELAKIRFTPFPIPGTPLVVSPILSLHLTADGSIEGSITFTETRQVQYTAELNYDGANWNYDKNQIIDEKDFSHEVKAGASIEATVSPQLDLMVNGVIGPYARLDFIGKVMVVPCSTPWFIAKAGAQLGIGVNVDLLNISHDFGNIELLPMDIVKQMDGVFPYNGVVSGVVTDFTSHAPLDGVNITFTDAAEGRTTATTGANGVYSLALPPCTYSAEYSHEGYASQTISIEGIVVDQVATHDVALGSTIDHIVISPTNPSISISSTVQLTATAYADSAGTIVVPTVPTDYTWSVTSGSGSVNAHGLFTAGNTAGQVTVMATHKQAINAAPGATIITITSTL